jgi:hypothetical protein
MVWAAAGAPRWHTVVDGLGEEMGILLAPINAWVFQAVEETWQEDRCGWDTRS